MPECDHARIDRCIQEITLSVRGEPITLDNVAVPVCIVCHEEVWSDEEGDTVLARAYSAYRAMHGLLDPATLRFLRGPRGLTSYQIDALAGLPDGCTEAFEQGALQTLSQDTRLRQALFMPRVPAYETTPFLMDAVYTFSVSRSWRMDPRPSVENVSWPQPREEEAPEHWTTPAQLADLGG